MNFGIFKYLIIICIYIGIITEYNLFKYLAKVNLIRTELNSKWMNLLV